MPAKAKVEAKRPAGRKPVATDDARARELELRLAEALEHQAATSEILRVISASPSDVQPVLDAVAERAAHLCKAPFARVLLVEGDVLLCRADYSAAGGTPIPVVPVALKRTSISGRAVLDSANINLADIVPLLDTEFPDARENTRRTGFRACLAVPLMRKAGAYGAIFLWRREPGLFSPEQVALVETFARQVAIAIDNVRLFMETKEALEQQTATGEILRAISSSPTDVEPVLETVVRAAARFCGAPDVTLLRIDGDVLRGAATVGAFGEVLKGRAGRIDTLEMPLTRDSVSGRAALERRGIHVHDLAAESEDEYPMGRKLQRRFGHRTMLAVPLLREDVAIGVIDLFRTTVEPFSDKQVELLKTFADQAVIAIENVRLFTELDNRNRELIVALDQQTATSEILRVISSSQMDLQPVFDAIVRSAVRLCGADHSYAARFDGELLHPLAFHGFSSEALEMVARKFPMRPSLENVLGRVALSKAVENLPDTLADPDYSRDFAIAGGWRSLLAVPMLRDGDLIGAIAVGRATPGAFPAQHVDLLKTFADQAVIAIENVRLFKEVETRNRELTEALEQQTATSEILRAISRSPTDVQPVFDIIGESAEKLCDAEISVVSRIDGELIQVVALHGVSAEGRESIRRHFPMRLDAETVTARTIRRRAVVHIPDALADPDYESKDAALAGGYRACLGVPMFREGQVIGSIFVARGKPGHFTDAQVQLLKTFADQAVIAIENVRLFTALEARNRELTEALEQQTATSEILRVISSSPTDVQPVFDIIAQRAGKLCDAEVAVVSRFDGTTVELAAIDGLVPEGVKIVRTLFPMRIDAQTFTARAIRTSSVVHIADVLADPDYAIKDFARAAHYRSGLAVPIVRDRQVIGSIFVGRAQPGLFSESQVGLLKTFADQAVIAIENVRLFTELGARNRDLTEALEQQTATSEILRVISQSQTDVQPVFDTIVAAARELCRASSANVVTFDGELIHVAAVASISPDGADAILRHFDSYPRPPSRDTANTRAVLTRSVVVIPDVLEDKDYAAGATASAAGYRSVLSVPLMREDGPIGAITVARAEPGPFPEKQVTLLKTFADQAVIAIENVRLFTELDARNRDLTEALEQQTATSEILRVISQSQTDVQPVFETIAAAAMRLCRASVANVVTLDGDLMRMPALANVTPDGADALRRAFPRPVGRDTGAGRAIVTCDVVAIPDVLDEPGYGIADSATVTGFRSVVAVPLVRDGKPIGAINVGRLEPGSFADNEIALLRTFADQAVIAIENVRLFKELEARTTQLTRSVGELKALGEVGQAVGSTLDLETVLRTIASRATELAGMDGGAIYEYDEAREEFHLHTTDRLPGELVDALRSSPIPKGEGAIGQLAVTGEPVEIGDIMDAGIYQSRVREILLRLGYRSLLAVPLLREDHLLGGLVVNRRSAGAFAPEVIELLKTFATQSALAIQNARLFREIEVKGRQLEVASRHKSEFLANMSHELRTPLNAIIGFSEVLSERMFGEINDKQAEYLADILESGRHLLSLINDILDLSKIEAGRMELEPADFNLPGAIENALTLVRERAQRRGIALRRTVDERLSMILADERKVKQVLLNLLSNALKFTPEGGQIDVRAEVRDGMTEISVTDTGVGIAPEDQVTVFEEFRQVGSTAKKVEGTGLGLAISRKFIELHGGRIWVSSEVGVGSTFAFTLPLPAGQGGAPA